MNALQRLRSGLDGALPIIRRATHNERLRRWLPVGLVLGLALWVVQPLRRQTPLSYDHATHLFKAWHFWNEMLPQGRLRGWSHFWAFGFPSDELVPFGSELWICLFRALTFGQLSWLRTYALAFAALLVLKALTAYFFTRRFFGATAGVAGAAITLLDPGAGLQGGWHWHTLWGVWPVELSMCFLLLAFVALDRVLERGSARRVALAAVFFAAALLTHQLALVVALLAAPLLLLDHAYAPRARREAVAGERQPAGSSAHFFAGLGALAFGAALAAFWVVPFIASTAYTQDLGWVEDSLSLVSQKLLTLSTFGNVWAPVHGLALIGAWFAFRERRAGAVFFVISGALFVFLSSDTLIADLHLERALSPVMKVETPRMLVGAKLFWFALAGHGFAEILRRPRPTLAAAGWRRWLAVCFGLACLALLVAPGAGEYYDAQLRREFQGEQAKRNFDDFMAFARWSRDLERPPGEVFRIAYHFPLNEHLATLAPIFNGIPMYKIGSTPTQIFNEFPTSDEPELFQALGVKYVLSAYPLQRPDLELERRFGQLYWYRFNRYQPLPFTFEGGGRAELLEFEPERIRIRLDGTSPGAHLRVHVANYNRWRATLDGQALPIASVPVFGAEYPMLMELPVHDGELVIRYGYRGADWLGLLLTLASVPAFLGLAWLGSREELAARATAVLRRSWRPIALGLLASGVAFAIVIALRTRDRRRLLPPDSIFHLLHGYDLELDGQLCSKMEPLIFECGGGWVRAQVVPGFWGLHTCMTTPSDGQLRVKAELPLGSFLAGRYDPRPKGSQGGALRLEVNGTPLGSVAARPPNQRLQFIQFDTRAFRGQTAELSLDLSGSALHCFDFRVLP